MRYDHRIDGLRAIAIFTVIIYHLNFFYNEFQILPGGFFGVDVFFVISGYLITGILIEKKLSLKEFYIRRARRILPVLLIVVLTTSIFGYLILLPDQLIELSESSLSNIILSSNIYFWFEGQKYADETSLIKPLLHTWTLSVEEQFYLIYPLIILFFKRNKTFITIILIITFFSLLFSKLIGQYAPNFNFYLIFSRAWELGFGCILYISKDIKKKLNFFLSEFLSFTGLFLIFFAFCFFNDENNYPNLITLIPVVGTMLLIFSNNSKNTINIILQNKILTNFGLLSYSMYLWHYPIISFAKLTLFNESFSAKIVYFIIIIVISIISYNLIEKVFRNKQIISLKKFYLSLFFLVFSNFIINIVFIQKEGFQNRYSELKEIFPYYEPNNKNLTLESWRYLSDKKGNKKVFFDNKEDEFNFSPKFNSNKALKLLFVGDSHSKDLFNVFYTNKEFYKNFEFSRYGFNLEWLDNEKDIKINIFKNSNLLKEADIIIISNRWNSHKIKLK